MSSQRILVIGAGPTGIGAAYRLHELGHENWALYERNPYVGGHASSHVDEKGFLWDEGGHVIFSHHDYFDRFLERLLGSDYLEHERQSWVRILGTWVPYPFQNNIRHLPKEALLECLMGLVQAYKEDKAGDAANFGEWTRAIFGQGIADLFMYPYNFKVWAYPLEMMDKGWMAERVSMVDLRRVLSNVVFEKDDVSWGPNNKFKFPLVGGTGEIYRRAGKLFESHVLCNKTLVRVDPESHTLTFADGTSDYYDDLVTTMPVDQFVQALHPANETLRASAQDLHHNGIYTVGIGVEKRIDTKWCWLYFPESNCPFYRVTYFHNYSPNNVPGGRVDTYSSFMCEVSFSPHKPVTEAQVIQDTIDGLVNTGLLQDADRDKIVTKYANKSNYAYPIPTLARDRALAAIQPYLMANHIYSRGRFGAWKYEIGNMDHSVMQGVQAVDHILSGAPEQVWNET